MKGRVCLPGCLVGVTEKKMQEVMRTLGDGERQRKKKMKEEKEEEEEMVEVMTAVEQSYLMAGGALQRER